MDSAFLSTNCDTSHQMRLGNVTVHELLRLLYRHSDAGYRTCDVKYVGEKQIAKNYVGQNLC